MKTTYFFSAAAIIAAMASNASASHIYANSISMHNIATIQDSILHTAMHTFDRVPAVNLGGRTKTMMPPPLKKASANYMAKNQCTAQCQYMANTKNTNLPAVAARATTPHC